MYRAKTPQNEQKLRNSAKDQTCELKYINTVSTKMSNEDFSPQPKKKANKNQRCLKLTNKQKMLISLKGTKYP
jgi:hypothetical protein